MCSEIAVTVTIWNNQHICIFKNTRRGSEAPCWQLINSWLINAVDGFNLRISEDRTGSIFTSEPPQIQFVSAEPNQSSSQLYDLATLQIWSPTRFLYIRGGIYPRDSDISGIFGSRLLFLFGFLVYLAFWGRERSSADGLWFLFHIKQQGKEKSIKTSTNRTKSHNRCLYLKYTAWQHIHARTHTTG